MIHITAPKQRSVSPHLRTLDEVQHTEEHPTHKVDSIQAIGIFRQLDIGIGDTVELLLAGMRGGIERQQHSPGKWPAGQTDDDEDAEEAQIEVGVD